jgi:hypothetical protein
MFHIGAKCKPTNSGELILVGVEKAKDLFRNADAGNVKCVLVKIKIKGLVTWRICRWIAIGDCSMAQNWGRGLGFVELVVSIIAAITFRKGLVGNKP